MLENVHMSIICSPPSPEPGDAGRGGAAESSFRPKTLNHSVCSRGNWDVCPYAHRVGHTADILYIYILYQSCQLYRVNVAKKRKKPKQIFLYFMKRLHWTPLFTSVT